MTAERDPSLPATAPRPAQPRSGPADVSVALVVAARKGDPSAFARMVEHWDGHLRPFVHHTLGGEGSTDRVLAATYVRAWRSLPRYRGERTPGLWLHRVAYLAATDELRRLGRHPTRRRGPTSLHNDHGPDPLDGLEPDHLPGAVTVLGPVTDRSPAGWPTGAPEGSPTGPPWGSPGDPSAAGTPGALGDQPADTPGPGPSPSAEPTAERSGPDPGPEPIGGPVGPLEWAETVAATPPGWRRLAPDQRALAVLVDLEGYDIEAVAGAFDSSPVVVAQRLGAARRILAGHHPSQPGHPHPPDHPDHPDQPPQPDQMAGPEPAARPAADPTHPTEPAEPTQPTEVTMPAGAAADAGTAAGAVADAGTGGTAETGRSPAAGETTPETGRSPAAGETTPETGRSPEAAGTPDPESDEALARNARAVLRAVPVPEPGPTFWADLGRRLLAERESPAAPALDPIARLARAHPAEPGFAPATRGNRAARAARAAEPPAPPVSVATLADQADWVRPRRRWDRVAAIAAALVVVAAIVAGAVWLGTSERIPDGSVAGRDLAKDVAVALDDGPYQGVVATVEEPDRQGGSTSRPYQMILSTDGSWLVSATDRIDQSTYDVGTGLLRRVAVVGDGDTRSVLATEETGLAAGSPDPGPEAPAALGDLQTVLLLLRGSADARAPRTRTGGLATWTYARTLPTGPGGSDERWRVAIRRSDDLPVLIERHADTQLVRRVRLSGWRVRTSVDFDTFQQPLPEGVPLTTTDHGFLTTSLDVVPLLGRGQAITPAWLPAGFDLASVTVRQTAPAGAETTAGGANPADVAVLSIGFQRGPERITLSTRARGTADATWQDPFGPGDADSSGAEERILRDGRLNGTQVRIGTDARGGAQLWAVTDDLVLTVGGDLTPAEAFRLASSLR